MRVRHSIIGLSQVLQWAVGHGNQEASLLERTGIDHLVLADPHATVTPDQELQFYQNLIQHSSDPAVALRAGMELNAGTYGIWGLALMSSASFENAIQTGLKYIEFTYTYNHIDFEILSDAGVMRIEPKLPVEGLRQFMVERDMGAIHRLFVDLLEQNNPLAAIRVTWSKPVHHDTFESLIGCPVRYDMPFNEMLFDPAFLNYPLPQANPLTQKMCYEQLDGMLPKRMMQAPLEQQVFDILVTLPIEQARLKCVADKLNLSERSVRRKLAEANTSFQTILVGLKQALAEEYLGKTNLTIEQIADKLGYSDAASFSHAYKRWHGVAPSKKFGVRV